MIKPAKQWNLVQYENGYITLYITIGNEYQLAYEGRNFEEALAVMHDSIFCN